MLILISPAMNMKEIPNEKGLEKPIFNKKALELVDKLKKYPPWELETLLGVNESIALKAFEYYQDFSDYEIGEIQALKAFEGLAYKNINCSDFSYEDNIFANNHLRILSSIYGILKPNDGIKPYRMDFICKYGKKNKLYDYWSDLVYKEIFKNNDIVFSLCSKEYESLIKKFINETDRFYTCKFLDMKNGVYKCLATASKIARGRMVRYIVKNKITNLEDVKNFNYGNYKFSRIENNQLIFIR